MIPSLFLVFIFFVSVFIFIIICKYFIIYINKFRKFIY